MSFQGSLQELPVPDIIQLVAVSGKTGMFTLTRGVERGHIYLRNGQMVHARVGELVGEEAVYSLAIWSSGNFQFTPSEEPDAVTIEKSNTTLLMESARRLDEWKVLSRKIPGLDSVPALVPRDAAEPVTMSPLEWNLVIRIDGRKTVGQLAQGAGLSSFDTAKVLYGLVTGKLVEMRSRESARTPAAGAISPAATAAISPAGPPAVSPAATALRGDEKKILMILCTRVKQEADTVLGEPNLLPVDRAYRQALAEIDHGRGVEAVRDLIRQTEKTISSIRGPVPMKSFQDKMSLVMQPKV